MRITGAVFAAGRLAEVAMLHGCRGMRRSN
jgi:hypothetical protein